MLSKKKKMKLKQLGSKNDLFRVKLEYENQPIVDQRIRGFDNVDSLFAKLKKKFMGGDK